MLDGILIVPTLRLEHQLYQFSEVAYSALRPLLHLENGFNDSEAILLRSQHVCPGKLDEVRLMRRRKTMAMKTKHRPGLGRALSGIALVLPRE